jgi:transposase InsO family protein
LCDWLNLSPSGYYAWRLRGVSKRATDDIKLSQLVRREYEKSRGTYGSPRVFQALKRLGIRTSRKRVERLMREAGLKARAIKHYRNSAALHRYFMSIPNRRLALPKPKHLNQHWVADLTYLKVGKQWRYLATVMDLYSRRIIGWSLSSRKNAELTIAALKMAIRKRDIKPGIIFHTDRGAEFRAYQVQEVLSRHGIISSMNRPYHSIDNAEMESCFKKKKNA